MTLDKVNLNKSCVVNKIDLSSYKVKKAFRLGLTKGTILTVKTTSHYGSPIKILLKNFFLAIRVEDAKNIYVEKMK